MIIDQMNFEIDCPKVPQRIISLVPSQTELLFDLGLGDRVVGITKFCIHPRDKFLETEKIGGTKKFNFGKIKELNPDLIIGNKEENYKEGIEELKKHYPVWMSEIETLEDSLKMMTQIGQITGTKDAATHLVEKITKGFEKLDVQHLSKAVCLIWHQPNMVAGKGTFIDQMMRHAGFENAITDDRYPELSDQQLADINPEYILLSSEPFPFKEPYIKHFQQLCPNSKLMLVDGEMFSWYGSRLKYAPDYFISLKSSF